MSCCTDKPHGATTPVPFAPHCDLWHHQFVRRFCYLLILLFVVFTAASGQEKTPTSAVDYNARGLTRYHKGDYDGALADFNQSLKLDPEFWATYMVHGLALIAKGDYDGAIASYNRAIEINPTVAKPYYERGRARVGRTDNLGALEDFDRAVELNAAFGPAYENRGRARLATGDLEGAVADFDKAIDLEGAAETYIGRGHARIALRDYDEAIKDFVQAIAYKTHNAEAYLGLGTARFHKDDHTGALKDFNAALAVNPNYADVYNARAMLLTSNGDHAGAVSDFSKAISINPKSASAYYGRAWENIYLARGEAAQADAINYLKLTTGNNKDPYRLYMVLSGYLGLRQAQKDQAALDFVNHYSLELDSSQWSYQIVRYFRRELGVPELISLAVDKGSRIEARARVYIGLDMSLLGQRDSAMEHLRWVKQNGAKTSREYTLAVSELERLESPKQTPKLTTKRP
jgi:tetratricopeptide (TPR) repeat protein